MDFRLGLRILRELSQYTNWQQDFSVYESALLENLRDEERYGPSEQSRRDRARIVDQLNKLTLQHWGISFNDLCMGQTPVMNTSNRNLSLANVGTKRAPLSTIDILVIFANPKDTDPLRLQTEERILRESIRLSANRDKIRIEVLPAATIHDVRRALLEHSYSVVQFSGHGINEGIILENERGEPTLVPPEALADLIAAYSPPIQCVILNACYTEEQGWLIAIRVPYTIVTEASITDSAAAEFTRGFYDALGAGKDIEFAYNEGCRTIKLTGHKKYDVPVLLAVHKTERP